MKNVIVYSKFVNVKKAIQNKDFNVLSIIDSHDLIESFMQDTLDEVHILLYMDNTLDNYNIDYIVKFKELNPKIRIIYITADVDLEDWLIVQKLCTLIDNGIYDIYHKEKIDGKGLRELLYHPKGREDIRYILAKRKNQNSQFGPFNNESKETIEESPIEEVEVVKDNSVTIEEVDGKITPGYDNVIVVSSVKPGTGKSFIASNLATGLAKYGRKKRTGDNPRIALIEGDLQTLAVGTLMKVENSKNNLKTALDAMKTILNSYGEIIGTEEEIAKVKEYVMHCMVPYPDISNLFILAASSVDFSEWIDVNPYHYFHLIEMILSEFDVIVVDANSALDHKTTGPLLQLANICLYVIDLEYNNVRLNLRYQQALKEIGVDSKICYVLNRDITKEIAEKMAEPLEYDGNNLAQHFNVIERIPLIDSSIMLNRLKNGRPIVLDDTLGTIDSRMSFANLSNKIWPMENILSLKLEKEIAEKKTEK